MHTIKPFITILLLFLSCLDAALARCVSDDPVKVAANFYFKHRSFYFAEPKELRGLLTPRFLAALEREDACAREELCAIDSDPWIAAQDGEISKPISFHLTEVIGSRAIVEMRYVFTLSGTQRSHNVVRLEFERNSQDSCWLLSDFIDPDGGSLLAYIEKWHKEYGGGL